MVDIHYFRKEVNIFYQTTKRKNNNKNNNNGVSQNTLKNSFYNWAKIKTKK